MGEVTVFPFRTLPPLVEGARLFVGRSALFVSALSTPSELHTELPGLFVGGVLPCSGFPLVLLGVLPRTVLHVTLPAL